MHVFVTGGNAAGQAVVSAAKSADKVTLLVRGDSLAENMSDYLVQQIERLSNVEVQLRTEIVDGAGQQRLEQLVLRDLSCSPLATCARARRSARRQRSARAPASCPPCTSSSQRQRSWPDSSSYSRDRAVRRLAGRILDTGSRSCGRPGSGRRGPQ
jgi:hypothetical protein